MTRLTDIFLQSEHNVLVILLAFPEEHPIAGCSTPQAGALNQAV